MEVLVIKNRLKWGVFILFSLAFWGCDSAGNGATVAVPRVDIECSVAKCTGMPVGTEVVVNFTRSGCAEDQIEFEEYATGAMSLTCSGTECTGSLSSWDTSTIPSGVYYVCGWIDINDDRVRNTQDAFSEQELAITGSVLTLSDWGASYNSLRRRP